MTHSAGVYTAKKKDGTIYYRSSVTFRNKHISLGSYVSKRQAHRVYQYALKLLVSKRMPDAYRESCPLPFNKFIVLVNFRDHNVYIRNPIYLRRNYFEYYLDQETVLKFDIDDLFYYSEHRISRRGGHLFVADYGMQVSITDRYGIRAYAVPGRDYCFINQDTNDFRYENIEIINHFTGVTRLTKKGTVLYKAVIHVKSNYVIGYFHTDTEAAVAYNKAVDYLKQHGIDRHYETNYIEALSPSVYADLYADIVLPKSILNFTGADHFSS